MSSVDKYNLLLRLIERSKVLTSVFMLTSFLKSDQSASISNCSFSVSAPISSSTIVNTLRG